MERAPCSREWAAAELHRMESLTVSDPGQVAPPGGTTPQRAVQTRRARFGDFLEKLLEAIASSSIQPAGLGPRGFRGRLR